MEEQEENQSTESLPPEPEAARAEEAQSDGWDAALESFNDPELSQELNVEEKGEEKPQSQFEQGDPLNLDTLRVPHKYKGAVKEFVEKISSENKQQVEAVSQELGQVREASQGLLGVLKEIAQNPMKIADYVVRYGEQVGIDPQVIQQYQNLNRNPAPQPQQAQPEGVDGIFNKYVESLISAEDPQKFVGTLKSLIADTLNVSKSEMESQFKQWLTNYHEQIVDPDLKTVRKNNEISEFNARKGKWESAKAALAEKYQDFDKYAEGIKSKLLTDPKWSRLRTALNKGEDGLSHEDVLEDLYNLLSRNDTIQSLKNPKPKMPGLPPNSKHITTKKAGGSDWDDIQKEFWGS